MDDASVGPYREIERLGAGGMGEVFLAVDTRLARKVALKYLSDPSLDLPLTRERLLREARAAAQISHPNIAAIYDVLDTGPHPCIVMEYVPGETLAQVVARGPVPGARVAAIGAQLADALAHAHAAGVVHRDLKPANVVLTAEDAVKILDFGVARVFDLEEELAGADEPTRELILSRTGLFAGTPAYMSPEQLAGRPATPLSDIYSLGVTLFELLTSRRPFGGRTAQDLAYQQQASPAPLPSSVNGSVPPFLDAIVAKAMARDPDQRYRSAADMAADLRRARVPASIGPAPVSPHALENAEPEDGRVRRRVVGAVAACAAVAALAAWAYSARRPPPPPSPANGPVAVAVLPFTSSEGQPDAARAGLGFSESILAALDGLSAVTVLSRLDFAYYLANARDRVKGAGELGVTAVVDGEVTGAGPRRQFAVRVQQPGGRVLLKRTYAGPATGVASMERQAAGDIVAALNVTLTAADRERLRRVPACGEGAFADYVEGRALLDRRDIPGNAAKAGQAFSSAVAKDPRCAPAFLGLADACWADFKDESRNPALVDRARKALDTAGALDPDSPSIKRSYAVLYLGTGRSDQAEKLIREVIERRPLDDEPYRMRAEILDQQDRNEEAAAALQQAIRLRPSNAMNYVSLGNSHYSAGRYGDAIQAYLRGLRIQPDNVWLKTNLATAYNHNDEPRKAIAVYESVGDPSATMMSNLSVLYFDEGRYQEAAGLLKRALQIEPRSAIPHGNLGDTYRQLGLRKEAVKEYRIAAELTAEQLKVDDRDADALARHAVFDAKCGKSAEAVRHIRRAVEMTPNDHTVLYKRAVVHALLKQREEAVEWLRKAIEKGHSRARARRDPDLESIRKLPAVADLLRTE